EIDPPDSTAELADTGGPHQRGAVSAGPGSAMKVRIRSATASAKKVNTVWVYPGCRVATQRVPGGSSGLLPGPVSAPRRRQFVPLPHYLDVLLRQRARSIPRRQSGPSGRGFLTRCQIGVGLTPLPAARSKEEIWRFESASRFPITPWRRTSAGSARRA